MSLLAFLLYFNSCDPNISFTFEKSQQSVHFLDTQVSVTNGQLTTNLYSKTTDWKKNPLHTLETA